MPAWIAFSTSGRMDAIFSIWVPAMQTVRARLGTATSVLLLMNFVFIISILI